MGQPLRLLAFSHGESLTGGAERSLSELLAELLSRSVRSTAVVPRAGAMADHCRQLGIDVVPLSDVAPGVRPWELSWCGPRFCRDIPDSRRTAWVGPVFECAERLCGRLTSGSFDLVYTNTVVSPLGALTAARLARPHVWHLREFVDRGFGWAFALGKTSSLNWVGALSAAVVVNSHALRADLEPLLRLRPPVVIPNGPLAGAWLKEPERIAPPQGRWRLCLVGTLGEHKGQHEAVAALRILRGHGRDCEPHFYGREDAKYLAELRKTISAAQLADYVHFHGVAGDPRETFLANDIALVCSRCEAFGRVTVEAMATAMPVVAAATGATPEIIADGQTGLLYRYGEPEHLAQRVEELIDHAALRSRLAGLGRQKAVQEYSRTLFGDRMMGILRTAASQPATLDLGDDGVWRRARTGMVESRRRSRGVGE